MRRRQRSPIPLLCTPPPGADRGLPHTADRRAQGAAQGQWLRRGAALRTWQGEPMITINYGTGPPSYALGVRWVQLPVASVRVGGRQAVQWAHMHNLNHVCTCAVSAVDEATCVCVGRVSLAQCVVPAINNYIFRFITIPRGCGLGHTGPIQPTRHRVPPVFIISIYCTK